MAGVNGEVREFLVPRSVRDAVVGHARRKLRGDHVAGEERERRAYGLLAGRRQRDRVELSHAFPLRRNLRGTSAFKAYMDGVMREVAVPSETPFERRGWVADPSEVRSVEAAAEADGAEIVGSYHMHRVPWDGDPRRDTCTRLDRRLAEGSGLWVFIVSMVEPDRPILRAFFEGDNSREAPLRETTAVGGEQ